MIVLNRHDDLATTGITTAVVIVVAAMGPWDAWLEPLLRLLETVFVVAVGITCVWLGQFLFLKTPRRSRGEIVQGTRLTIISWLAHVFLAAGCYRPY
jgi:hypothetical protein